MIRNEETYISATVLLETEWVLRSIYGYGRARIADALRDLAALPRVTVEDPPAIADALSWARRGMDFADAMHLARSSHCDAFLTFDHRLARDAASLGTTTVRAP